MSVSLLRRGIAVFLEVPEMHLLVGLSWFHDLLEHDGIITNRHLPGTRTPCPYLQQGSRVNVFFERPAPESPVPPPQSFQSSALSLAVGGSLSFPLLVDSSEGEESETDSHMATDDELPTEEELQAAWRVHRDRTGGDPDLTDAEDYVEWREYNRHGPRYFASASGGRLGNPNPNHPLNQDIPPMVHPPTPPQRRPRTKNGERGRANPGERGVLQPGEHGADEVDALITAQLAADALQSSSVASPLSSRQTHPPLSDRAFAARKVRSDELFEGYRRVKRACLSHAFRHRDPEQEALSAFPVLPRSPASAAATAAPIVRSPAAEAATVASIVNLGREIGEIKVRMRTQWTALNDELQLLTPAGSKPPCLVPDDFLDSDSDSADDSDPDPLAPPAVGDPPSFFPPGPFDPPDDGGSGLNASGSSAASAFHGCFRDDFVGTLFFDAELGWCSVTAWGTASGTPILYYGPFPLPPSRLDPSRFFSSEADVLSWLRSSYCSSLSLLAPTTPPVPAPLVTRACSPVSGRNRPLRPILLSPRQLRRIMAARESLFKFGTFVPRNDHEANASPEAPRWRAGRDLEWLRLADTGTFEND
jgi:hypothetical protein